MENSLSAESIYKKILENKDNLSYLSSFVDQAESFNSKTSDADIVKQYLHLSGNGRELLQLVKAVSTSDSQIAILIIRTLCHILVRVANDLGAFISVGTSIANEILAYGMKSIFNFLKLKQKSSRTKLALHLLSSMVALGGQTAQQVVSKLDFSNITFTHLLNRKNFSEDEDVRTAFINLIILILTTCDFAAVRQLVEIKGFLNDILYALESDRAHIIVLILSTFRKLIVESPVISKTTKLKLFNDHSLKPVIKLYSWKGPVRDKKANRKRKLGEEEKSIAYEASQEEIKNVQFHAHDFMMSLCCSFKTGIIFHDSSMGSSGKNQNHVLTNILAYMPKPHTNKLVGDFVVAVLKTCPDQMVYYLPCLKGSCSPRLSSLWVDAIAIMKKIIDTQDPVTCLFKLEEKKPVSTLISIAKSICFPSVIDPSEISVAFKNGEPFICYHLCDYLVTVLSKVKSVTEFCIQAEVSKMSYSAADMSAFNQSFLTTIFQNFIFMRDLEEFWGKLTEVKEETCEEKVNPDLPLPSLSSLLSKILDVMHHFLFASRHCYHEYEVNVPKLFQSLKGCYSLLPREDICKLNIKIVDIISAQGEEVIMLWTKSLIESPLMVLLDVYMNSPPENIIEDVSQILSKVLVHTKVFDFCPWETGVWLESMKSSKAKHVPFIIEFINNTVCSLLQNPNIFSDDIIETTFGKSSSQVTLDVTSTLNDLLSTEKDPILIENFEESSSISSTPKLCFSSLVPAALFTLNSVDDHKKKSCQSFVEKVLYHIIHHQQSPEALFYVIQKYKNSISEDSYHYFELLCSSKYEGKVLVKGVVSAVCKTDFSEHLKAKFISLHTLQNSDGCCCDIQCELQYLGHSYKEKVIWQLLTYLDWEINLFLEDKIQNTSIMNYLQLLEELLNSFDKSSISENEAIEVCETDQIEDAKHKICEEILSRSSSLKLFLWIEKVPKSKRSILKEFVNCATKLILNFVTKAIPCEECCKYLSRFKDKVVKFNSYNFETINVPKNVVMFESSDVCHIIETFSTVFSSNDITNMLENLLNLETGDVKLENHFSALSLIFKMYIEVKDFILLSPKSLNSLFIKYTELTKKQKKTLKEYIMQIFEKHPILASAVNADSCHLLLKQPASRNFYILGCLVDCNTHLRGVIQSAILEDLEEFRNTPDFIYLVSKCILNSTLDDDQDERFLETVGLLFWETVTNYILTDLALPDMLLGSCDAGKAVQILFNQKILAVKKMSKFFKSHHDTLISDVPSSSKMLIFLQFMDILKNQIPESKKSAITTLKLAIHWLTSAISSFQSISEFKYFPLIEFTHSLLQNISEVKVADIVEINSFFQKSLKVAMKHRGIGNQLIEILTILCEKSQNCDVQSLFNLVAGHSNFFNIMLSQIKENEAWKKCVVELLITLVGRDKSVCKDNHLGLILSSYTGSLKPVDRKLLHLIKLYSESDVNIAKFSPFLWSKTAVAHYSVMNAGTMHLWKNPKLQDLLNIFTLEMLEATVEKYPLTLKLEPIVSDSNEELENCVDLDKIYDLRFFLPLLANVLSPGSFVHCRSFMDSKVLMLIFASLSSFDINTRALGYYCLSQLYFHLEGANYGEKGIWLSLLDSLRNSITSENPRIPSIVSLFLARVTLIFTKPDHPLFSVLYKFIMVKPNLDVGQVPEFYKLFNSLEIEHRIHRMWLLKLLSDGLRSNLDFHICEKRYIFRLILTHYWSSVATVQEKGAILDIISAAVKVDTSARVLSQNSVLSWLHSVIEAADSVDIVLLRSICSLLKNLWFTCKKFCIQKLTDDLKENAEEDEIKTKSLYATFPVEFQLVILSFLKKSKILDVASVTSYLFTLHDVLVFIKNSELDIKTSFDLSANHISQILETWFIISEKEISENQGHALNSTSFKQLSELITKIILLWSPDWKSCHGQYYYNQQLCVLKSVQLMLQLHDVSSIHSSVLPIWLYKCLKDDKNHGVVRLFLSPKGESCLRLILNFYEKSLTFQSQFSHAKDDTQLCSKSKASASLQWWKILSHFKKVCKNCNLTPDLNLYHQIMIIL